MAQVTNFIWQVRTSVRTRRESRTYYDADNKPISTDNEQPRPIRNYYHNVECYTNTNATMENIIWLISSSKDESLLVLHQNVQGNFDNYTNLG